MVWKFSTNLQYFIFYNHILNTNNPYAHVVPHNNVKQCDIAEQKSIAMEVFHPSQRTLYC